MFYFLFKLNSITYEQRFAHGKIVFCFRITLQRHKPFSIKVCSVNYSCKIEFTFVTVCMALAFYFMSRVPFGFSSANYIKLLIIWFFFRFFFFFLKMHCLFSGSLCTFSQLIGTLAVHAIFFCFFKYLVLNQKRAITIMLKWSIYWLLS